MSTESNTSLLVSHQLKCPFQSNIQILKPLQVNTNDVPCTIVNPSLLALLSAHIFKHITFPPRGITKCNQKLDVPMFIEIPHSKSAVLHVKFENKILLKYNVAVP